MPYFTYQSIEFEICVLLVDQQQWMMDDKLVIEGGAMLC